LDLRKYCEKKKEVDGTNDENVGKEQEHRSNQARLSFSAEAWGLVKTLPAFKSARLIEIGKLVKVREGKGREGKERKERERSVCRCASMALAGPPGNVQLDAAAAPRAGGVISREDVVQDEGGAGAADVDAEEMEPEERSVLNEGFLTKRSVTAHCLGGHCWHRVYCVLDDRRSLAYYDAKTGDLKGQVLITGNTLVLESNQKGRENVLEIRTPYVQLVVQAPNEKRKNNWRDSLNIVIREAQLNRDKDKRTAVRQRAKELRVPQRVGDTGRGTHQFKAGGTTFEVDKRYSLISVIGSGAYGIVVAANDSVTGKQVAIKRIRGVFDNIIDGKRILREVKLLRFLKHKNISHITDLMRPAPVPRIPVNKFDDIYIVTDRMDTDLQRIIYSNQTLTEQHVQFLMYQLLSAVHYCASANVLHRDLKPSNILVNSACELRVCDFGLARGMEAAAEDLTMYVVTRWYRAPELILACDNYSGAIDMWSVGCIFAELMSRKPLFAGEDFLHQLRLICEVLGSPSNEDLAFMSEGSANRYLRDMEFQPRKPWRELKGLENASGEAIDLLDKLLTFSPKKRLSALEALRHPFLKTYHKLPVQSAPAKFDLEELESMNLTRKQLRTAMIEEIRFYRGNSYERAASAFDSVEAAEIDEETVAFERKE